MAALWAKSNRLSRDCSEQLARTLKIASAYKPGDV
jgi:hypothetical protein